MKTAEPTAATKPAPAPPNITLSRASSSKVLPGHLEKLAVVYVRQSSPKQVLDHRESTARQYAFADQAVAFGWPRERVLTIDEDLGKSARTAEGRSGFQRLVTEVTLNHVGMVLGLEMSRLARSSKDWHAFFEMCAIFGTLIADEDGVYEGNDPNDRLLLGLKGIMSEMELHIMRNRLERGRDCKAQRGELFFGVPVGYVLLPTGEVDFDPDEQAREVMRLVFDKFDELGTIYGLFHWLISNNIRLPIRPKSGAKKGQLDWRRPSVCTLAEILRHPIYAGAYSFGRRPADPKRTFSPKSHSRPLVPMEQWKVLQLDRLPAYITWERYLQNRERIEQNRNLFACRGAPRSGVALLSGLLVCGTCGRRMRTLYHAHGKAQYHCNQRELAGLEPPCPGLAARAVDGLIAQQVLRALEPAAVELSIQAHADVEQERQRLDNHWQQRRQRARYDVELAERRYQAVDPANRLVAAALEKRWEESLAQEKQLQEEYDRFLMQTPVSLRPEERARLTALTSDIPALWNAPGTTNVDRKQIVRCLIERVTVYARADSEFAGVTIHWAGGYESQHEIVRPVNRYEHLRDLEPLLDRAQELRESGQSIPQIAEQLNAEGFHTPTGRGRIKAPMVNQLLQRRGVITDERGHDELLGRHEWWLSDLADKLKTARSKLQDWVLRGWVHGRQTPVQGCWILWADPDELRRLRDLIAKSRPGKNRQASPLKTPKKRSDHGS
jgi:DNA invertase Pin-like site-specific DNA recombinase